MPEHIRTLIVIMSIAGTVYFGMRTVGDDVYLTNADFARRRNAWFSITLLAFLIPSYWLFAVCCGTLLFVMANIEKNAVAFYLWMLSAVPPFGADVPGFGVVNYLFHLDYPRLLTLFILLPALVRYWRSRRATIDEGMNLVDRLLLAFVLLQVARRIPFDTPTNTAREAFYFLLDIGVPYYVTSRCLRSSTALNQVVGAYTASMFAVSAIAMFEFSRYWLLYNPLSSALGVSWGFGNYLARGALRAQAHSGHPIVLGYLLVVAIGLYLALPNRTTHRTGWWIGMLLLVGGLVASLSRGPWVATVAVVLTFIATGPRAVSNLVRLSIIAVLFGGVVLVSPWGDTALSYLPFVGHVQNENIVYRQLIIDVTLQVIALNPWFGSFDYYSLPVMQQLVQGEGIIDIVNTYVGIALAYGLVGLALFLGIFVAAGWMVWKAKSGLRGSAGEESALGRGLLAALVGTLVTIATTSSVSLIPVVYWPLIGMGVAYARSMKLRDQGWKDDVGA